MIFRYFSFLTPILTPGVNFGLTDQDPENGTNFFMMAKGPITHFRSQKEGTSKCIRDPS